MIILIGTLAVAVILFAVLWRWASKNEPDTVTVFMVMGSIGLFYFPAAWVLAAILCKATTGALPNYATGERIGEVVKVSEGGLVWRACGVEVLAGSGEQATFRSPVEFCVTDAAIRAELESNIGSRYHFTYRQWGIVPWSVGSADREIIKVKKVP